MPALLLVPALLAHPPDALARTSLAMIGRFAPHPRVDGEGIEAALCAACAIPPTTPPAPIAALGTGIGFGTDVIACADPITLVVGHNDVVIAGRVDDLSDEHAAQLAAALNHHFADECLTFVAARNDRWFVHAHGLPPLDAASLAQAQRPPLRDHLPRGEGGKLWNRWQNEIQMLLHDHAINRAREERGLPLVNGMWFWGAGRGADWRSAGIATAAITPGRDGDLARGFAQRAAAGPAPLPSRWSQLALARSGLTLVALPDQRAADLATLERDWLAPAAAAMLSGAIDALTLVSDGHGAAVTWHSRRPGAVSRVIASLVTPPFVIPPPA